MPRNGPEFFASAETGVRLSKADFDAAEAALRPALLDAQRRLRALGGGPLVVVVSGVEGAGKSEVVNRLDEWLDARGVHTAAFWGESDEERERPRHWRYWRALPPRGSIGVLFGSWYTPAIVRRAYHESSRATFDGELRDIVALERLLADDGAVLVKLWFHISRKAQRRRLERIARSHDRELTPWERRFSTHYDRFAKVSAAAIGATDTAHAPWHLIDAGDPRHREVAAARLVLAGLEAAAQPRAAPARELPPAVPPGAGTTAPRPGLSPALAAVDLSQRLGPRTYERRLADAQSRLNAAVWKAYRDGRSTVAVFEGWDAAGKGGAIRRVCASIDARLCRVVPVAAPSDEERAQHYLWRFWRHIPRAGYVTIFDRSWYGRVLVERIEGFAAPAEWQRAYEEINHFERQLAAHRILVHKFWLHVSPEEQLRRFEQRAATPHKQHKICDEDWRNRARWGEYEQALEDVFTRCATPETPWTLVAANDKRQARVQVVETLADRIEAALSG
ncbi:MAG: polyphosphate:AMP phosphotransferase [Rubrivivax sp.]|jgi:polyphosphate:AMP phosphotransferase|nr:polyphosphate:AMP phosphotransferase [Rubrivivax sp.]